MIFKLPEKNIERFKDRLNFKLAWNLANLMFVITGLVSVIFLIFYNELFYFALSTLFISGGFLLAFKFGKSFRSIAFAYASFSSLFFLFLMFFVSNVSLIIIIVWMCVTITYTFSVCHKKYGNIILIANAIGCGLYIISINGKIIEPNSTTISETVSNLISISGGFASLAYIVNFQIFNKIYVERRLRKSNDQLEEQNELISNQNLEKEVMMQEIHHRVKNNLQIISSLLRIQGNQSENEYVQEVLFENVNRISSIALIHEKIYQSKNLTQINYNDYLKSLIKEILKTSDIKNEVVYDVDSNVKNIGNRTLVPMALIFNELITNSLKHAFKNTENPKIDIQLNDLLGNEFYVRYNDNGEWKNPSNDESIGLDLIEIFTQQLEGSFERTVDEDGTTFEFNLYIID